MQELGYFKVACLGHINYRGVFLWNKVTVDWFSAAMWFDTYGCLGGRSLTRGLVRPPFVAKTTWFGIPDFCNAEEEEWGRHSVEDHEVSDGNDV